MKTKNEPKILIAIDISIKEPYLSMIQDGPYATWAKEKFPNISTISYFCRKPSKFIVKLNEFVEIMRWNLGKYPSYFISYLLMWVLAPFRKYLPQISEVKRKENITLNNEFLIKIPEALFSQRWKKLAVINYFYRNADFDFLLLITPSCYIQTSKLFDYAKNWPLDKPFYAGSLQVAADGPFIAGGALVMNRLSAKALIDARVFIPTHTMDDVAFGVAIRKCSIELNQLPILNITDGNQISLENVKDHFYIRVKGGTQQNRTDASTMRQVHQLFEGSG
jgi:hypothetical protein